MHHGAINKTRFEKYLHGVMGMCKMVLFVNLGGNNSVR